LLPGEVTAYLMTCPADVKSPVAAYRGDTFRALAHGRFTLTSERVLKIDQRGASAKLGQDVSSVATGALCTPRAPDPTSRATLIATAPKMTLIGQPTITGRAVTKGRYGQLDARVWDRDPKTGKQRLITRGAYRLDTNQKGNFVFTLDGNGWRFAKGHRVVVELLGRDAPTYAPSPNAFRATLSHLKVHLPVAEAPGTSPKITAP
jgi:hypothetical protein